MGIFSKRVTIEESDAAAIAALGAGVLRLDEEVRNRVGPTVLAAVKRHLKNQSTYTESHRDNVLTMFRIISGTVGLEPMSEIDTHNDEADEVRAVIQDTLPINVPLAVVGAIRMVVEEYITGRDFKEIDMEKFDKHDSRQVVHAIMGAVQSVNERCILEPKKHTIDEITCLAVLVQVVSIYTKKHLSFK